VLLSRICCCCFLFTDVLFGFPSPAMARNGNSATVRCKPKPTLHLVYSTKWVHEAARLVDRSKLSEEFQKLFRFADNYPHCCELTTTYFQKLLAKEARSKGFNVVRWRINGRDSWLAVGEAARSGCMVPGAAAVLLHSWTGDYEKECVPALDYYPVLEALKAKHLLLYPSAPLDRLHSEKRYTSSLMPPTAFLQLLWHDGRWRANDGGDVQDVASRMVQHVTSLAQEADLSPDDIMVKCGLSWGGKDVVRLKPSAVPSFIVKKLLPKLPGEVKSLTVLLQAKVNIVAELRWVVLDGKLRGRGWRTFRQAPRGAPVTTAGVDTESESREALIQAGLAKDNKSLQSLEESMRSKVSHVLAEATADADGQVPQFLRVDLLIDTKGHAWLGERESWGADLIKRTYNANTQKFTRTDPQKPEVATAMIARALRLLDGAKACKHGKSHKGQHHHNACHKRGRVSVQRHLVKRKAAST